MTSTKVVARCYSVPCVLAILSASLSADSLGVRSGEVRFEARTNVPGVNVIGRSSTLEGGVTLNTDGTSLLVDRVHVRVAVPSLRTGMKIRDKHMRSEVFNADGGNAPDLVFDGADLVCPMPTKKVATCEVRGTFRIRGEPRPLGLSLEIRAGDTAGAFRVAGNGVVMLSDYDIDRPSQFGVRVADEVAIHVSFVADRQTPPRPGRETALP